MSDSEPPPTPIQYSSFEKAVFYVVQQVPYGKFTSIKTISKFMDSSPPTIGRVLQKAPPGVPTHRVLQSQRAFFLARKPGDIVTLAAEGIMSVRIGKLDKFFGKPWDGFVQLPVPVGRDWFIPVKWVLRRNAGSDKDETGTSSDDKDLETSDDDDELPDNEEKTVTDPEKDETVTSSDDEYMDIGSNDESSGTESDDVDEVSDY
ncbi:hypothetical protein FN846DRAFT_917334 [Sphaerosporella brunnea]|uniref:Methylated-DNA-[protein]-cysteine S-methyltransferase DNA binding domain-containing protein n=1 Tax=Sphaerosporella brunnea TaxID=1250544 RepID=A0A5J5F494_9PEZI|nr:hypothetical protein FN846DRAFT_917334 [Sphaerosporella brunnea]